jgi:2-iminobutanoate/2-iminopropanoate deaminase
LVSQKKILTNLTNGKMIEAQRLLIDMARLTKGEQIEMSQLGILSPNNEITETTYPEIHLKRPPIQQHAVHAPGVLNEAYEYQKPSSFSRATHFELGGSKILLVSGTASVNDHGKPEHIGDFKAQLWRTYRNITTILETEEMSWHDVVRTTNYLRDIERDYEDFNKIRTTFFDWLGLNPLPASTGIQARLCWETLLVEIEVTAICPIK